MSRKFIKFNQPITAADLPNRFNFPFDYQPEPIARLAAEELKKYLVEQQDWEHNFGLQDQDGATAVGKMFGVLVVENQEGEIGYLAAFSGKLAGRNQHEHFVPPIYDMLDKEGFFVRGVSVLNAVNARIEVLEKAENYCAAREDLKNLKEKAAAHVKAIKSLSKAARQRRKLRRAKVRDTEAPDVVARICRDLDYQSVTHQYYHKDLKRYWQSQIAEQESSFEALHREIEELKQKRMVLSGELQERLFAQYNFRNLAGGLKNVREMFADTYLERPPSGAGECAAPKLLQYAFEHQYHPISMAEFWWGKSPQSEIRHHGQYYPACRGKCKPILEHMLEGIETDPDPRSSKPYFGAPIEIVYEDDFILVVSKPPELLSVPGKKLKDSVYLRMRKLYPGAEEPMIVHRLDMSTSGLMVLAKTKAAHKQLQLQFLHRQVSKVYVAELQGVLEADSGIIDLPLAPDFLNRPRQLVCYEQGKEALTEYLVIAREGERISVEFRPLTGRTHQLRVHAAHSSGLNCPIVGDDLYGQSANRLHLHARDLSFRHPETKEGLHFSAEETF